MCDKQLIASFTGNKKIWNTKVEGVEEKAENGFLKIRFFLFSRPNQKESP